MFSMGKYLKVTQKEFILAIKAISKLDWVKIRNLDKTKAGLHESDSYQTIIMV